MENKTTVEEFLRQQQSAEKCPKCNRDCQSFWSYCTNCGQALKKVNGVEA